MGDLRPEKAGIRQEKVELFPNTGEIYPGGRCAAVRKVMNLRGFLLMLALLLAAFLIVHPILRGKYNEKAGEENALQARLLQLEDENRLLTGQLEIVGTKDYIVTSAMENYSYINKDDIRFEFTNPEALYAYTEDEIRILMDEMAD